MIEILEGIRETIRYEKPHGIRLFHNVDYEDYPEHWHTGLEIIMPLKEGYGVLVGKKKYELKEGDIIILNSGVLHGLEAPPTGERIIMQFSASLFYSFGEMETLLAVLAPVTYLPGPGGDLYQYVKYRMDEIVREYDEEEPFFEALIVARLIEIFGAIGRETMEGVRTKNGTEKENQSVKKKEYMQAIMEACTFINHHCQENITLEEAAAHSGFSKFHFTRIFKQCMDMTFYEYLNQKRITKAQELLDTTELRVTDIAMSSGFSSISAFNRTFKSIKGCSPSEYRNKLSVQGGGHIGLILYVICGQIIHMITG